MHPTQIYEAIFLGVFAWVLIRWRRQGVARSHVLGRYFVLAGAFRFAAGVRAREHARAGPLTVAHLFALLVVLLGVGILMTAKPVAARHPHRAARR